MLLFIFSPEGAPKCCGKSRKCGKVNRHSGKCDSKRQVNAFWKKSPVFEYHKKRQILEEGLSNLQVRERALFKKEEDVSSLQRQTEALLKESGKISLEVS